MGFRCGIVGLPNVGKSTLFNALTQTSAAQAANYMFCTIDPNVGEVAVPDPRLDDLASIAKSQQIVPTRLTFVDIAGLVRGASKGEGMGNQFLSHIREMDAIIYMLRCFEDSDIMHVEGKIDPISDAETIETELMLSDLESMERRLAGWEKKAKGQDKEAIALVHIAKKVIDTLGKGHSARFTPTDNDDEKRLLNTLQLLTTKPVLYVANVEDTALATNGNEISAKVVDYAGQKKAPLVIVSAAIEAEIVMLPEEERSEYLQSLGMKEPALNRLIRAGYALLDLVTFFTVGPKETRAWTVERNTKAPRAAAAIHTDFEKGFIRAETIAYDDFITFKGESGAREAGKMRLEGKEYIVQDGDVLHFRFAV